MRPWLAHAKDMEGWLDIPAAIDATRALTLRQAGYHVHTQCIPADITPKNRLLVGMPLLATEAAELS